MAILATRWINFKYFKFWQLDKIYCWYTGLPTEDETSETIEKNLFSRFACIYDSLQMKTCFSFRELLKKPQKKVHGKILNLTIESSYSNCFRSSLQSHPLYPVSLPQILAAVNKGYPISLKILKKYP